MPCSVNADVKGKYIIRVSCLGKQVNRRKGTYTGAKQNNMVYPQNVFSLPCSRKKIQTFYDQPKVL